MKKILPIILFFFATCYSFGQQANTASALSGSDILKGKENGLFDLKFPDNIKKEDIEKYAVYYQNTFQTSFDAKTHVATFKMLENTSSNRRVILRFLAANQIQYIIVDGLSFIPNDFYEKFLK